VSLTILLDTGPLGLVTNPKPSPQSLACAQWLQTVIQKNCRIIIPEISDYELRRELLRANKQRGLSRLDTLAQSLEYLPLTTAAMRQAAALWAQARQLVGAGQTTGTANGGGCHHRWGRDFGRAGDDDRGFQLFDCHN
jgi:predicted nucleic acid-binding protein